jgi:hypothetical protein
MRCFNRRLFERKGLKKNLMKDLKLLMANLDDIKNEVLRRGKVLRET